MKICPNCKTEYGNKKTQCPKCKVKLVRNKNAQKNDVKKNEDDLKITSCNEDDELDIKKDDNKEIIETNIEYNNGLNEENVSNEIVDDKENQELDQTPSIRSFLPDEEVTYKYKKDLYADNSSSAFILLIFGCGGLFDIVLNALGMLNMFTSIFQYIIGLLTFSTFIMFSLYSFKKAKQIKKEISKEDSDIKEIKGILKQKINDEFLEECDSDELSDEENYFKRIESIKTCVISESKDVEEGLVDLVIEEYYNENY